MGEVIQVPFGVERDWEATRAKIIEGLMEVGPLFGDSPELMRAKGEATFQMLRAIINSVPTIQFQALLPEDLSDDQAAMIHAAVREAVLKGVEVTLTHSVACVMETIYDLCTSKLRGTRK